MRIRAVAGRGPAARVAIAVVRAASAVERNRARRRVRAALGTHLPGHAPVDVVLSVGAEAARLPFADLSRRVERALLAAAAAAGTA